MIYFVRRIAYRYDYKLDRVIILLKSIKIKKHHDKSQYE